MDKEKILSILSERLKEEGLYFLVALSRANGPLLKEKLRDVVNDQFQQKKGKKLINSRYTLDIWAARLEGAGLVDVQEVGRARLYSLAPLGEELINFTIQLKKAKGAM